MSLCPNGEIHDACLPIHECGGAGGDIGVAEMSGVDSFCFSVDESELEGFVGGEAGKPEAETDAAIGESGLVMDVSGVSGFLAGGGNFQDALVDIRHFDVRHAVGSGAVPAVADGLGEIAIFLAGKRIVEDALSFAGEPLGVWRVRCGRGEDEDACGKEGGITEVAHERATGWDGLRGVP